MARGKAGKREGGVSWQRKAVMCAAEGEELDAATVDAGGAYVVPGGIDRDTHLEMPLMGTVAFADFFSGTASALPGGTTMIIETCLQSLQSLTEGSTGGRSGWRGSAPTMARCETTGRCGRFLVLELGQRRGPLD